MKTLNNLLRVLLALSLVLSACAPLANDDPTPTAVPSVMQDEATVPAASPTTERTTATDLTPAQTATTVPVQSAGEEAGPALPPVTSLESTAATPLPTPAVSLDESMTRLDDFIFEIEDLRAEIDRTQFDLGELGFELGFEASDIVDFVRSEIAFEQYSGLLRGAQGTLMSHAGNTLDQAVLLATLLGDAGYETRIARGTLSDDEARLLLRQMGGVRTAQPAVRNQDTVRESFVQLGQLAGRSEAESNRQWEASLDTPGVNATPMYEQTDTYTAFVLDRLTDAGVELGGPDVEERLLTEARDYFWVEYRLGPSDSWQGIHPVFESAENAPANLEATNYLRDSIPEELQHRVRIEVFVEQKFQDELIAHGIMPAWERPAANMVGIPIEYQNFPNGVKSLEDLQDLEASLEATGLFLPIFNGDVVMDGRAFDVNGTPFALDNLGLDSIGATALFQEIGSQFEDAAGALGGLGESESGSEYDDELVSLTAQWVEYTLIAPGGTETTYRRYVIDRIGRENRARGETTIRDDMAFPEALKLLLTSHTIMVVPGTYNAAYAGERTLERARNEFELLEFYQTRAEADEGDSQLPPVELLTQLTPMQDVVLNTLFEAGTPNSADMVNYRPEPALIVFEQGFLLGEPATRGFSRFDVVNNTRRVLRITDGGVTAATDQAVRSGIWETFAEQVPLANVRGTHFSPMVVFRQAHEANIPTRVLRPENVAELDGLALSAETKWNLRRDLEAGYVVIVPEHMTPGLEMTAWWRVDPDTGETLGVGSDGRGPAATEYQISKGLSLFLAVMLGSPFALVNYQICTGNGGSVGCCLLEASGTFAATLALGYFTGMMWVFVLGPTTIVLNSEGVLPSFCSV